ncbi:carbonyl reductase [NADPH] 1-like [Lycorma delicatula]|uniref:carbonyl reductase [NADPH] 1-like n=1 Tax=Lycorma delicatula TaxID=130591 RepID=UPI003F5116DC
MFYTGVCVLTFTRKKMSEIERVAVVTGSNKGIGYEIVKGLCKQFKGKVYLTSRSIERGMNAVKEINKENLYPEFHQLDITKKEERDNFAKYLKEKYGGIDVLVNNAAIAYKVSSSEPFLKQAVDTLDVNYFSTLKLCAVLFPLLRPHARVVNLSSSCGHLTLIPSPVLRKMFSSDNLTSDSLTELVKQFITDIKNGEHTKLGWPNTAYGVSKVAISALTFCQQREFDNDEREDIVVNCVHPGYCDTDMSSHKGPMPPDEGAKAAVKLALLPHYPDIKGKYVWHDMTVVDWINGPMPRN